VQYIYFVDEIFLPNRLLLEALCKFDLKFGVQTRIDLWKPEMLDLLETYAAKEGITNIVPVLGTETDPRLPAHGADRILLVDVYHEFQQPEPMLARIRDSLAPGGTVTLVEYRLEGDTASHINIQHRMSAEQVLAEWTAAGFELIDQLETLPSQHLFIFSARRGARPR
jgi:hypothetical protein